VTTASSSGGTFNVTSTTSNGFWWNGVWNEVRPSAGDDDGPPTGVREPRRPKPTAPAAGAVRVEELV